MEVSFKKVGAAFLAALLILMFFCSCAASTYEKVDMLWANPHTENVIYYELIFEEHDFTSLEPVTEEWQEFLDASGQALVDFLNEEYGSTWKYEPVTAYGVNLQEANSSFKIGGIYDPDKDCIYLAAEMLKKSPADMTAAERGYVIHELEHFLKMLNTKEVIFSLKKGNGQVGWVFNEAMTNYICYKWLVEIGDMEAARGYWQDGYATGMFFCQELELIIPDLIVYYLEDNIKALSKDFNKVAKAHIESAEDNMFEAWLWQIDRQYEAEHSYKANPTQDSMNMLMYYLLGNTEILACMTETSSGARFIENFEAYDESYWGTTFCMDSRATDYFNSLFYVEIEE